MKCSLINFKNRNLLSSFCFQLHLSATEDIICRTEWFCLLCASGALPSGNWWGTRDTGAAATEVRSHFLHRKLRSGKSDHGSSCQTPHTCHPGAGRQEPLLHRQGLRHLRSLQVGPILVWLCCLKNHTVILSLLFSYLTCREGGIPAAWFEIGFDYI